MLPLERARNGHQGEQGEKARLQEHAATLRARNLPAVAEVRPRGVLAARVPTEWSEAVGDTEAWARAAVHVCLHSVPWGEYGAEWKG